jgi:hypothetical protein
MTSAQAWQASFKGQDTKEEKVLAACFSSIGTGVLEKRRTTIAQTIEQLSVLKKSNGWRWQIWTRTAIRIWWRAG